MLTVFDQFYKKLERELGLVDCSWIWKITLESLERVSAQVPARSPRPDEAIVFRDFLLQHKR